MACKLPEIVETIKTKLSCGYNLSAFPEEWSFHSITIILWGQEWLKFNMKILAVVILCSDSFYARSNDKMRNKAVVSYFIQWNKVLP